MRPTRPAARTHLPGEDQANEPYVVPASGLISLPPKSKFIATARNEAAQLSGASTTTINKAIEQRVVKTKSVHGASLVDARDVGALTFFAELPFGLPVTEKAPPGAVASYRARRRRAAAHDRRDRAQQPRD
jgi:hypothetical protein